MNNGQDQAVLDVTVNKGAMRVMGNVQWASLSLGLFLKVSEYDQEMPQYTADQSRAPRKRGRKQ